jgi:hypothetical protein
VGQGQLGVDFDGLAVCRDGLLDLVLVTQGVAEVGVGLGQLGVEFDGLAERGDGLLHLVLLGQGDAEVVVGLGVLGVEFDSCAERSPRRAGYVPEVHPPGDPGGKKLADSAPARAT